ncbi:MAG: NAD-dependent deacylase [Armatimonadota bacterium]|nr:NAD-dependent deacylase [Armatimonadota bacterium]
MSDVGRAASAIERAAAQDLPIVSLTGAGISRESGIPTFRGQDGIWQEHDPEEVATLEGFLRDPERAWRFHEQLRELCLSSDPNPAHTALAWIQKSLDGASAPIITQNIDGLHQAAGSRHVIELHGSAHRARCTRCDFTTDDLPRHLEQLPPTCDCGAVLRPDVVWFGEQLPREAMERAQRLSRQAGVMLVIGTSATVQPAASLPVVALRAGASLVEINPEPTALTGVVDIQLRGPAGEVMPELAGALASALG